ncbi:hypothetical protein Nepgr_001985 [Nepenthes gracilis]|uniref:Mitochondrial adenine nucleotide transporter BTL3 n=1 Tax=Nepenthes gracilis TaxID=150966 RepID=A0AAD3P5H0_NEPGR|nr:hypothetical protein Nepgr_001985 [Nepenthes gracilis]
MRTFDKPPVRQRLSPPSFHPSVSTSSIGGLFLDTTISSSFVNLITYNSNLGSNSILSISNSNPLNFRRNSVVFGAFRRRDGDSNGISGFFLSLSLKRVGKVTRNDSPFSNESDNSGDADTVLEALSVKYVADANGKERLRNAGTINTTKHLCAGAVAAMVSRTFVAPLERLKLEYIVRGEQKNIFELIRTIAATQGLTGFWKGNFLNILRTAPFKAINFCVFDIYRKQLLKLYAKEETSNSERLIAGAAAGITATVLCLPLDTIRTRIVADGGAKLHGVIGAFCYIVQNEGFSSLYKGLLPSMISMAPSSAVFYSVYDILKSAYLRSPEGKRRIQKMKQQGMELTALGQLELGPLRTLLYGAISGACAEATTYPFEVLRRQLQMQVQATKLNALATFLKIVQQGGIPALYAGLFPSLLQVLPSAATSYFVYEFVKVLLEVE